MKKGSLKWFNNLVLLHQLQVFKRWRIITLSNKKHWCLDELKQNISNIKFMLKELKLNDKNNFNDLHISFIKQKTNF